MLRPAIRRQPCAASHAPQAMRRKQLPILSCMCSLAGRCPIFFGVYLVPCLVRIV